MNVVIVGGRHRSEAKDQPVVSALLEELKKLYPDLYVITAGCDRGVGKIVKAICMPDGEEGEWNFVEYSVRVPRRNLPAAKLARFFMARTASLVEIGEEFHIFLDKENRGIVQDVLERVLVEGLPVSIYNYDEETGPKLLLRTKQDREGA